MWDSAPDSILHQLIQRDGGGNTDVFGIWFNCFDDGVNGVRFSVTPDGVQSDELLTTDGSDGSWNAVWQSECRIDADGWTAEFALPWSVFRFTDQGEEEQQWGMNFLPLYPALPFRLCVAGDGPEPRGPDEPRGALNWHSRYRPTSAVQPVSLCEHLRQCRGWREPMWPSMEASTSRSAWAKPSPWT